MKDFFTKVIDLLQVTEVKEKVLGFSSGSTFSTLFFFLNIDLQQYLIQGVFKTTLAILIGICGGVAGLFGKDAYTHWLKPKLFKPKR